MSLENFVTVRIPTEIKTTLDRLAQETGRSRSNVVRSLLVLAAQDPANVRKLGELPQAPSLAERMT